MLPDLSLGPEVWTRSVTTSEKEETSEKEAQPTKSTQDGADVRFG